MVTDLVCVKHLDGRRTKNRMRYNGRIYHFCSDGCREEFTRDKLRYISWMLLGQEPVMRKEASLGA